MASPDDIRTIHTVGAWELIERIDRENSTSAHYIRRRGVRPGEEHSIEAVEALFEDDAEWPTGLDLNTFEKLQQASWCEDDDMGLDWDEDTLDPCDDPTGSLIQHDDNDWSGDNDILNDC